MNRIGVILCLALLSGLSNPAWAIWSCEKQCQAKGADHAYNLTSVETIQENSENVHQYSVVRNSTSAWFTKTDTGVECDNILIVGSPGGSFPGKCEDYYQSNGPSSQVCVKKGPPVDKYVHGNVIAPVQYCKGGGGKKLCQSPNQDC